MRKYIHLEDEKKREMVKFFGVTRQTVWYALTFRTKRGFSDALRAEALKRGGVLLNCDGEIEPNLKFDTYFTEVPRQMVQVFTPRVKIVGTLENCGFNIMVDGKVVKSFSNVMMDKLYLIQAEAQEIVNCLKTVE